MSWIIISSLWRGSFNNFCALKSGILVSSNFFSSIKPSPLWCGPTLSVSVSWCWVIRARFVICIVNRAVHHGGVPATGNDADQSPRFYAPSIDHLLGGCPCPAPAPCLSAPTTQIPRHEKVKVWVLSALKVVLTACSRRSYFGLSCILKDAVNCWKSSL